MTLLTVPPLAPTQPSAPIGPPRRRPRTPSISWSKIKRRIPIWVMLTPALLGLGVFFVYPLCANVYFSFTRYNLLTPPVWVGLKNYVYLFTQDPNVPIAALNTLWLVLILVPVRIITAMAMAGLLARRKRAAGLWRTIFYIPALVPPVAATIAFVFLFNPGVGLVNKVLASIGIKGPLWFNDAAWSKPSLLLLGLWVMGDIMIIFLAALLDVPKEQYEAASLDGANAVQRGRYVTLPNISPVVVFAVITGVIWALQYFTEAAVASSVASGKTGISVSLNQVLGYPDNSLLTYAEWLYVRGFTEFQLGYSAALAVVLFVVTGLFLFFLLRRFRAFSAGGTR